jgi:hypothetical protein
MSTSAARLVSVNLLGTVEQASVGSDPYRLGDGVYDRVADHAAPGACLVHPDPAAASALSAQACIGNPVQVRTGGAAGALGAVAGKRGEGGRVIAVFDQDVLGCLRPGDQVAVRGHGQGMPDLAGRVAVRNVAPELLERLPVEGSETALTVGVRAVLPSRLVGNGIGRPTPMWDLDLQLDQTAATRWQAGNLRLGDLVAIDDLDARYNAGYRRGWRSVGLVVHGASPQPGHGPGVTVILTGPAVSLEVRPDPASHAGLDERTLLEVARASW